MEKKFKELMEILVGRPLGGKLSDEIGALQNDCLNWQKNPSEDKRLVVAAKTGYEPCPFNYSGGSKLAKLAMIGINPGKPLEDWLPLDENTTWKKIAEFYAPSKGINNNDNAYYKISKGKIQSKFYKDTFLIHQALIIGGDKVYDDFDRAISSYGSEVNIEREFIEQFDKYPVFNSDLIPYKSKSAGIDWNAMKRSSKYRKYLNSLIELMLNKTDKGAYVIFYGARDDVRELLSIAAEDYFPSNIWRWYMLENPQNKDKKTDIYLAHWRDERIVALIPSRARTLIYNITELTAKIKEFRLEK